MAPQPQTGRKTAIRLSRLTLAGHGPKTLAAAEAHGKRLDASSQRRRIANVEPLVHGGLDLQELFAKHAAGCRMDARTRSPVIHALVQWPTGLAVNAQNEKAMLAHSTRFLNDLFGGEAVFAARLDRDESGRHTVDVFLSPIITKTSKAGTKSRWIQTSAPLKALCHKHAAEIIRRHPTIRPTSIDNKRCQGIALQSEWRQYLQSQLSLPLDPKQEKGSTAPDRLTPEEYALEARASALAVREATLATREAVLASPVLKEAVALLSGDETPQRQTERHQAEKAEDGCTWEEGWEINGNQPGTPTYWQQLRQHVSEWWRDRIKRFGLDHRP